MEPCGVAVRVSPSFTGSRLGSCVVPGLGGAGAMVGVAVVVGAVLVAAGSDEEQAAAPASTSARTTAVARAGERSGWIRVMVRASGGEEGRDRISASWASAATRR